MIGNYIRLALRHMVRQRSYVFINGYDDYNEKKDRIWRLYLKGKLGETELEGAWTCSPAAPALKQDFPEVVDAVRLNTWGETVIKYKDRSFIEDGFMEADSTFFNIFSIPMIQGDPQTALAAPHTVVLTKNTAERIFGNSDPVGEMIKVGTDSTLYTITGIMENVQFLNGLDNILNLRWSKCWAYLWKNSSRAVTTTGFTCRILKIFT